MTSESILITGGTGFIGRALVRSFLLEGHDITVLTRDKEKAKKRLGPHVRLVSTFEECPADAHFSVVINLAGAPIVTRWNENYKQVLRASRIGLTEKLVSYIGTLKQKPRVMISGSAIGYYGVEPDVEFKEESQRCLDPIADFPRRMCRQWEEAALPVKQMGVRLCILRLGVVLQKDGGALKRMLLPFKCGLGGNIGSGKQWVSWIHRRDVTRIIKFVMQNDALEGPFNATAPKPLRNRTFTQILARALKRPAFFHVPAKVMTLLLGEAAESILLRGQKVVPDRLEKEGFEFLFPTLEGALKDIL